MSNDMGLKVIKIGDSYGLVLPKDILDDLGVKEGDILFPCRVSNGIQLSAYDSDFEEVLASNRDYMERHKNALKELAK
jgi:putative addiction module antidote